MKAKKQHKLKTIVEYRSILSTYNYDSAVHFNGLNVTDECLRHKYLAKHHDRCFGTKIA